MNYIKQPIAMMVAMGVLLVTAAHADDTLENMKFFKSGGIQHGKWQVEMLEGSDPSMQQMMQKTGKMTICMDIAKQMAKEYQHDNSQPNSCSHQVVKDSATSAEVEVTCDSGTKIHSLISRDDDKTYTADATTTSKENKVRHMKVRYLYQGECTGDGAIQFDKDSAACKMMRKNTEGKDMTALCARLPENAREQCVQNMKSAQASCQ